MDQDIPKYLQELNPEQQKAAFHRNGPLLIVAGAGAGKTKTLTHRILHLIKTGVPAGEILAITFTNKAARELQERLRFLLEEYGEASGSLPFASTFHSLCVRMLRAHAETLGLKKHFSIFDREDSLRAIKKASEEVGVEQQWKASVLLSNISRLKSDGITYEMFALDENRDYKTQVIAEVWEHYARELAESSALDFDDLLVKAVHLLEEHPHIREEYRERWKYVHVDEYQDTNKIQYRLTELLVGAEKNICVVGDADQTIYTWRGATIDNILSFEKDFPGTLTVLLEQNYRSTQTILAAANKSIAQNQMRKKKNLFTRNEAGKQIEILYGPNEDEEARVIAERVEELTNEGIDDIALLYRTNFQSRALEEALICAGIPYQLLGTKFFERKEVKDMLSYVRYALNPASKIDLIRLVQAPRRGIGPKTFEKIVTGKIDELGPVARTKAQKLIELLENIRKAAHELPAHEVLALVLKESGLEETLRADGEEGLERLQNIQELIALSGKYAELAPLIGLERLLEEAALMSDQDELNEKKAHVVLMTVHAAKGLEFDYVFITGLEEGLFPQRKEFAMQAEQEEERRLFYVALTRARKQVFLSYAGMRQIFGSRNFTVPSIFLTEMDPELIADDVSIPRNSGGYLDDVDF